MGCGDSNTVVEDAVEPNLANELTQLDASLDNMDKAMLATMKCFNDLITALDKVSHIYSNLAIMCNPTVREHLKAFDSETRNLQEKGAYPSFNGDVHGGSIAIFDSSKKEVKGARQLLDQTKKSYAEYQSRRKKVEKMELEYAKKGTPVSAQASYKQMVKERDQKKAAYEQAKQKFEAKMNAVRDNMNTTVLKSSSNYANCSCEFFKFLSQVLSAFGDKSQQTQKITQLIETYNFPQRRADIEKGAAAAAASDPNSITDSNSPKKE